MGERKIGMNKAGSRGIIQKEGKGRTEEGRVWGSGAALASAAGDLQMN